MSTTRTDARPLPPAALARAVLLRALLFAALWWVLVEGALGGWILTLLSLAAAVAASLLLIPPTTRHRGIGGMLRFIPFFLVQSIRGGADVARRALHPRLPIAPGYHNYAVRLPDGSVRTFFTAVVGLLPGTLSVECRDGTLRVHVLDERMPTAQTLRVLEDRVADLFGVEAGS
jgi:multicomponent Na+:H+ antiporter subunit E